MFLEEQSVLELSLAPTQGGVRERQPVPHSPAAFALPGWGGHESS